MASTPTTLSSVLRQEWAPGFELACVEESVFSKHAKKYSSSKLNNQLNINIIPAMTGVTAAATATTTTDDTTSWTSVNATPSFLYASWYPTVILLSRLAEEGPAAKAGAKRQLAAALATKEDTTGTALVASLTTSIEGGAVSLDKALMLKCLKDLAVNAKDHWKPGKTKGQFIIYPSQTDALLSIPEITAADIRGDSANPNVSGWVWNAWNCGIEESGNLTVSAGVADGVLLIPDKTFGKGYNMTAQFLPEQNDELVVRFITVEEVGFVEVFDYDGVRVKMAA